MAAERRRAAKAKEVTEYVICVFLRLNMCVLI